VLAGHGDLATAAMGGIASGSNALALAERLLAILHTGGLRVRAAAWALDLLLMFVAADVYETALYAARAPAEKDPLASAQGYLADVLSRLPDQRFPHLRASTAEMTTGDRRSRLDFGLDVLIAGLSTMR
jgi:hypothetical protein